MEKLTDFNGDAKFYRGTIIVLKDAHLSPKGVFDIKYCMLGGFQANTFTMLDLYTTDNWMIQVMDGNTVYHCENVEEHKFWNHPFEDKNILHLSKNASETDWTSEQDYKLVDGSWNVC